MVKFAQSTRETFEKSIFIKLVFFWLLVNTREVYTLMVKKNELVVPWSFHVHVRYRSADSDRCSKYRICVMMVCNARYCPIFLYCLAQRVSIASNIQSFNRVCISRFVYACNNNKTKP